MITFKPSGINGFPCSKCNSSSCIHCNRNPCLNCAKYQHPDSLVIHIGSHIICHQCVQEVVNLIRSENNFYGLMSLYAADVDKLRKNIGEHEN